MHVKWSKWKKYNCNGGLLVQERCCRRCGWREMKSIEYGITNKVFNEIKRISELTVDTYVRELNPILLKQIAINKEKDNDPSKN